ncbi:MAG: hypothetical protein UHN59_02280 [Bacteroidales bacterium]|nr:hypothetical protein [Bacteroidales bacterium]
MKDIKRIELRELFKQGVAESMIGSEICVKGWVKTKIEEVASVDELPF